MEELYAKADELNKIATFYGLDTKALLQDIADSMEIANELTKGLSASRYDLGELFSKWWFGFLEQYFRKCLNRWLAICGNWRDHQRMQNLWFECFEPLWIGGCSIVKDIRLEQIRDLETKVPRTVANEYSEHISKADEGMIAESADKLASELDPLVSQHIAYFKGKQREAIAKALRDLGQYDKASPLGKLKRIIFR